MFSHHFLDSTYYRIRVLAVADRLGVGGRRRIHGDITTEKLLDDGNQISHTQRRTLHWNGGSLIIAYR